MATDKLFYMLATEYPASVLKWLGVTDCDNFKASSYTVKAMERHLDIVFENQVGDEKLIYVEFQCYKDATVLHTMVIKILQYSIENDFHGDIKPVIVFDKKSYCRNNRPVNYSYDGNQHLWFNPVIIILENVKLEELEAHGDIHLVPLYPLCGISAVAIEEQAPKWVERIKKESASDLDRENILALLGGFIAHRLGAIGLEKLNSLLGDFKMEETQVGKDLINIGHISGWKEGLGEGLEKGIAKGMAKGRREEAIQVLVLLLEQRFGKVPVELVEKIQRIKKIEKIHQLIKDLKDLMELGQLNNMLNLSSGLSADDV